MRFWWRALLSLAMLALLVVGVATAGFWYALDGSLPRIDGNVTIDGRTPPDAATHAANSAANRVAKYAGLSAPTSIVRDNAGHVTIEATTRTDAAFATGYAHAQDRFFQMDLLRRVSAGELAELFGQQAVRLDEQNRMHRFRARAQQAVESLPAGQRALLDAYAAGVNASLSALKVRPFEYLVLRADPRPWRPEDSLLALYAMYLDLQSGEMRTLVSRSVLAAQMPPALSAFLLQPVSHWDAPLDRAVPVMAQVDGARPVANSPVVHTDAAQAPGQSPSMPVPLPTQRPAWLDGSGQQGHASMGANDTRSDPDTRGPIDASSLVASFVPSLDLLTSSASAFAREADWRSEIGSNSFAVAGTRTTQGSSAMVANDMHLGLSLPEIWYRLSIHVAASPGHEAIQIAGVSLPGAPLVVVGSNTEVAWGFTNSYGHYVDLVEVQTDPANPVRYRSPPVPGQTANVPAPSEHHDKRDGSRRSLARREALPSTDIAAPQGTAWQYASTHLETIAVKGAAPVTMTVYDTRWGPEWHVAGHVYAVRWVAHDPQAANLILGEMEQAHDVRAAMNVAQRSGIPTQNVVIADREGHIAWTLAGPLPRRPAPNTDASVQVAPVMPVPADRYTGWEGYLDPASYPVRIDPDVAALWTANNRQLDSTEQLKIGDGGSDLGARATQIRDDLAEHERFDERGLLSIQLDDRAKALAFWRDVMLEALDAGALENHRHRQTLRALVSQWDARAGVDSVGYTLVRDFESAMYDGWFGALDAQMSGTYAGATYRTASSRSVAVMETLASAHAWVPQRFGTWQAFVLNRVDAVIARDTADGALLDEARWGDRNRASIAHPFARMLPGLLAAHLSAPPDRLPGDVNMPRVQARSFGASERMVVSPGHESQGILEVPGGASGHPLSPFFLAGHEDWVHGNPSSFLPGPQAHRLVLQPAGAGS